MRWSPFFILLFAISCKQLTETEKLQKTLIGNWLVIAPDHHLKSGTQKWVYSQKQDSIVQSKSLKLVSFSKHGIFRRPDNRDIKGRWGTTEDNRIFIEKGGAGFDDFNADFKEYKNGILLLTEFIEVDDEKIEVVWNLKKVTGRDESRLFDKEKNEKARKH